MTDLAGETLDIGVIAGLRALGKEPGKLLAEFARDFLAETPLWFDELARAAREDDLAGAARLTDRLRGTRGHVGARRLAAACAQIERYAMNGDSQQARTAVAVARPELGLALRAVRALLI
jgi:hypothetical protein